MAYEPPNKLFGLGTYEPPSIFDVLFRDAVATPPTRPIGKEIVKPVKRRSFFSFHFDDVMRVNNVRQAWKIDHPDNALMRSFQDSSLWESKKLEGDDAVKRLIIRGVRYTSAVCVLIGSNTWSRRWVRYEIARSIIDRRGLLAVHINGLSHHHRRQPDPLGSNPLDYISIYRKTSDTYQLYEFRYVLTNELTGEREARWVPYPDFRGPVPRPNYLPHLPVGGLIQLSACTRTYDFVGGVGHRHIGGWIDRAAQDAGR